jgi:hypothetical protein
VKVQDLMAYLQTQDPDAEVLIEDADTDWLLPLHVTSVEGKVHLWGRYIDSTKAALKAKHE